MERVICLFIGYVFGLFQTAYFYGKTKGIDIRKYGSGNADTQAGNPDGFRCTGESEDRRNRKSLRD